MDYHTGHVSQCYLLQCKEFLAFWFAQKWADILCHFCCSSVKQCRFRAEILKLVLACTPFKNQNIPRPLPSPNSALSWHWQSPSWLVFHQLWIWSVWRHYVICEKENAEIINFSFLREIQKRWIVRNQMKAALLLLYGDRTVTL